MTFIEMLFSFKGRIGRLTYWGVSFALLAVEFVGFFILDTMDKAISGSQSGSSDFIFLLLLIFTGFIFWSLLAISVKRWHDRDKSGWWMLVGFIPIIGGWWVTIELGFMKGTEGINQYGERAY
jgi:uncharacterized membrane protein YhaH (DUF805 family)